MKLEYFYTGLLVVALALVVWFSVYLVVKLFQSER